MEQRGSQRVEMVGVNDKWQITAILCGTVLGDFLPVQLTYQEKTPRCHPKFQFPSGWDITHSPKHWSTEETMIWYINNIIIPYVERVRQLEATESQHSWSWITLKVKSHPPSVLFLKTVTSTCACCHPTLLIYFSLWTSLLTSLQKNFLRRKFQEWYSKQVMKQLEDVDIETCELEPIDLSLSVLKEVGAKWLVEMAKYFEDNPMIIVNGFIRSGIIGAWMELKLTAWMLNQQRECGLRGRAGWRSWEPHSVTFRHTFIVIYISENVFTHISIFSCLQYSCISRTNYSKYRCKNDGTIVTVH